MLSRVLVGSVFLFGLSATGCQAAMVPAVGPTIDTQRSLGVEARVDIVGSLGPQPDKGMFALGLGGPGGGYHQQLGGYFSHSIDIGGRYGDTHARPIVRGRSSIVFAPRVSRYGASYGNGALTEVMVGVAHGSKPFQTVLIGPRFQGEAVIPFTSDSPSVPAAVKETRGMFSLSFAVEMIFMSVDEARIRDPQPPPQPPPAVLEPREERPPLVVPE